MHQSQKDPVHGAMVYIPFHPEALRKTLNEHQDKGFEAFQILSNGDGFATSVVFRRRVVPPCKS
jgi:hypothetical protein